MEEAVGQGVGIRDIQRALVNKKSSVSPMKCDGRDLAPMGGN